MASEVSVGSVAAAVKSSFTSCLGDVVFGMEDGAVSIFGLVFGVAASANDGQVVLLAGATGAAAAAVSMMAGDYLETISVRDTARARLAREQAAITQHPERKEREIAATLRRAGLSEAEVSEVVGVLAREPARLLGVLTAFDPSLGSGADANPWSHALWMFTADIFAAATPVLPFVFFPIDTARAVSLAITSLLLLLLGVGRGLIAHRNVLQTALETLSVATAAAVAGVLIGRVVSGG
ncbi:MAG TPA: VIT1/CCC1 transporter family protein [Chloroflexota bacterium]|nr:VIT1/CCC1 transporter family protein [Chloroflexota bacterium]